MGKQKIIKGIDDLADALLSSAMVMTRKEHISNHAGAQRGVLLSEDELKFASATARGFNIPEQYNNTVDYINDLVETFPTDRIRILNGARGEKYYFLSAPQTAIYSKNSPEEVAAIIRQVGKELTSGPDAKEKSLRFLQNAGIAGKDGKLTKPYRSGK